MKVALVHDPLYKLGGAELVLEALHELYPDAPVFTPIYNPVNTQGRYEGWDIRTSFLQKFPGHLSLINFLRALMPLAVEQWDLMEYDLVISDTTSVSKGVITRQDALHIAYLHNVTRFAWMDLEEHISGAGFSFTAWPARIALSAFRQWDFLAADRPDILVANSQNVAQRIEKYYRRKVAEVLYPPVEVERFQPSRRIESYFLIVSRLEPHKKVDLAVQAFNELKFPLKIVGDGPELRRLQAMAKPNVELLGRVSDESKLGLLSHCQAFIYPQEEDFGITAVEAMASGRPVIAYGKGGALETIVPGITGEFFSEHSASSLKAAVAKFNPTRYTSSRIAAHAAKFSKAHFKKNFTALVERNRTHHGT